MNIPALLPRQLARLALRSTKAERVPPMAVEFPMLATSVAVTTLADERLKPSTKEAARPAHHVNDSQTKFTNPWPSFRQMGVLEMTAKIPKEMFHNSPAIPSNIAKLIDAQTPDWGLGRDSNAIKATWLGHACYLVELPAPGGAKRGPRILFDPALSDACFAIQSVGPKRYTPVPCLTEDIPEFDAIVLSHNHYDHMDTPTLRTLWKRYKPQVFAPLGNGPYLGSLGIGPSHIHILDWWDSRLLSLSLPGDNGSTDTKLKVICTPCQHLSGRSMFDRQATLWASWAVETEATETKPQRKVYFGGDTGYRTVFEGEDEDEVPVCPAFVEIGDRVGPFDLALIPIGAYGPQHLFSMMHASPRDSVRIFQDIKAKKALAMHWGTWILTTEPIMEPPQLLREACDNAGISQDDFDICGLGETRLF